jgi:hypothetical protein
MRPRFDGVAVGDPLLLHVVEVGLVADLAVLVFDGVRDAPCFVPAVVARRDRAAEESAMPSWSLTWPGRAAPVHSIVSTSRSLASCRRSAAPRTSGSSCDVVSTWSVAASAAWSRGWTWTKINFCDLVRCWGPGNRYAGDGSPDWTRNLPVNSRTLCVEQCVWCPVDWTDVCLVRVARLAFGRFRGQIRGQTLHSVAAVDREHPDRQRALCR